MAKNYIECSDSLYTAPDEVLAQLATAGNREAEEFLVSRYHQLVRACARPFFLVGGDSEDMGRILSIMAFLEIPMMVCVGWLRKKFSCEFMLKVASIGFTLKIFFHYIATNVAMIYFAQIFQLISFGIFLPVMVIFIDEVMSKGEAVKGQAFFTMMTTVASIIGSLIGGVILDLSGAKMLTLIATVFTAVGTAILIATVDKVKK